MRNEIGLSAMRASMVVAFLLAAPARMAPAASPAGIDQAPRPPYPPSAVIEKIEWDFEHLVRLAPGSDLWPVTWADDDHLYASWGDGGGFGGTNSDGRASLGFARIEGGPTDFKGINVWAGKNALNPPTFKGKTAGILCVGGVLYAWINVQNGQPPDHRLAWSADHGARWELSEWTFPRSGDFFPATFLNCGRDYAGARDDYVYTYGARWTLSQGPENHLYLMRVHKEKMKDRTAYEFCAGFDPKGAATWTPELKQRKPVFTDPNGVGNAGLAHVAFHPGLRRYLLTVGHRPKGEKTMAAVACLGVFDAPEPWGPWTTVAYYDDWGSFPASECLGYDIPTKWISSDGMTMWCVFSSTGKLDSFNLVRATLTLRKRPAPR